MNTINSKSKVAVIGLGKIGVAISTNLTRGKHAVILASRDHEKSKALATKLGSLATSSETKAAIKEADVVIPALYFNSLKEFFQTYSNELEGKVIVDVSNPIAPDGNGGFRKIVGENESSGQILSEWIPSSSTFVKAFGTLGAESLLNEAFSEPERKVLFYASEESNKQIEKLIEDSGFDPFYVGGIDQSIRIEVFGELHQFGALGGTTTLLEAGKLNK